MSTDEIIAKVKAHPELWQQSHPFYRHRHVVAKAWFEIAEDLDIDDVNWLKKRWKHLKDSFRKEAKKVATNQIAMSAWIHFNDLQFLTDEVGSRTDTKDQRKVQDKSEESEQSEKSDDEKETEKKRPKGRKVNKRRFDPTHIVADTHSQSSIKFRKIMDSLSTVSKFLDKSSNSDRYNEQLKNDTDYMFLVSLLPTMRGFDDVQRLHFRGKINSWLLSALTDNEYPQECDSKEFVQSQIIISDQPQD